MRFPLFYFSLLLSFLIPQSVNASRVVPDFLERLGDNGIVSVLDDRLRSDVIKLLPKGKTLKSVEGQLLQAPSMGRQRPALVIVENQLHIFRDIPKGVIDTVPTPVIPIKAFPKSGKLREALTPRQRSHTRETLETKAAPPLTPPVGRRRMRSTRPKTARAKKREDTASSAAVATVSTERREPNGAWNDLKTDGSMSTILVDLLTDQDADKLAATSKFSQELVHSGRRIPLPAHLSKSKPLKSRQNIRYDGAEFYGPVKIFPGRTATDTPVAHGHLKGYRGESWYKGALAQRFRVLKASTRTAGSSVGGAGRASDSTAGNSRIFVPMSEAWTPHGRGELHYVGNGYQEMRKEELLRGIFSTDTDGIFHLSGRYSLSNGNRYTGNLKFIDDQWRRIGKGTEVSGLGHHLTGDFKYKNGIASAANATLTLPSGASKQGTALQLHENWVLLPKGAELPAKPTSEISKPSVYVDNVHFADGDTFHKGSVYRLPMGAYYVGTMEDAAGDSLQKSGYGHSLYHQGMWSEATFVGGKVQQPTVLPTGTFGAKSPVTHHIDGSHVTLPEVTGSIETLTWRTRGPMRTRYQSGASIKGDHTVVPYGGVYGETHMTRPLSTQIVALADSPIYRDVDGSVWLGLNVGNDLYNGRIDFDLEQWWPHGQGELKLPDGRVITGNFKVMLGKPGGGFQPVPARVSTVARIAVPNATVTLPGGKTWRGRVEKTLDGWKQTEELSFGGRIASALGFSMD